MVTNIISLYNYQLRSHNLDRTLLRNKYNRNNIRDINNKLSDNNIFLSIQRVIISCFQSNTTTFKENKTVKFF